MALTQFQRDLCRLIARNRVEQGEAYVAGGLALYTGAPDALSRDCAEGKLVFHKGTIGGVWPRLLSEDPSRT